MSKLSSEREIQELTQLIENHLEVYARRMSQIGVERKEILRLFARRLERMEVETMKNRVKENVYGKKAV